MSSTIPVLIVGAGPTGLTMALLLEKFKIPYRILDKQIKPVKTSNALGVQPRTLELWQDLKLIDAALDGGNKIFGMQIYQNKKIKAKLDLSLLESKYPFVLGLSQHNTEQLLIAQIKTSIEFETAITDFECKENKIFVSLQNKDGTTELLVAVWLLACDGAHSQIRETLKIDFKGKELAQHFVLADFKLKDYDRQKVTLSLSKSGLLGIIPYDHNYIRLIAEVSNQAELAQAKSLMPEQIKNLIQTRYPLNDKFADVIWTSGFWIHERLIDSFRYQNIFFAGDSAHIHSPAGGQGMNTGIQDAYNLIWKLAWVILGKAKPEILDTYQSERYPVAKKILRTTTGLTNVVSALPTIKTILLTLIRNISFFLLKNFKWLQKKVLNQIAQLQITYESNLLVADRCCQSSKLKTGKQFRDKNNLVEKISYLTFTLLIFYKEKEIVPEFEKELKQIKQINDIHIILISPTQLKLDNVETILDADLVLFEFYKIKKSTLTLVRPDKYIAFSGTIRQVDKLVQFFEHFHLQ